MEDGPFARVISAYHNVDDDTFTVEFHACWLRFYKRLTWREAGSLQMCSTAYEEARRAAGLINEDRDF